MRNCVTIGELAAMMNISTHQIRYFEEKKVLAPEFIDENGYRMYGLNEIYKLSHILLLRKFDIPVSEIKECFDSFSREEYIALLKTSIERIDKQISDLITFRNYTSNIICEADSRMKFCNEYKIKYIKERKLHEIARTDLDTAFTAKQLYDYMKHICSSLKIHEADILNLYDSESSYMCIELKENSPQAINHTLIEGEYLCYEFYTDDREEFETKVNNFIKYSEKQSFSLNGKLITIENSMLSMFDNNKLYYELQMLIV